MKEAAIQQNLVTLIYRGNIRSKWASVSVLRISYQREFI